MFKQSVGLLAGALAIGVLTGCSESVSDTVSAPTVATTQPSVNVETPPVIAPEPLATETAPPFSATPSRERVIACRAAEQAFATSPKPLVIRENGSTNRIPRDREIAAYKAAMHAAFDLEAVEPELGEMSFYFFQRLGLLRAAAAQDGELVKKSAGIGVTLSTPGGPDRSPLDLRDATLLDDACAAVGSVTTFR